LSVRRLQQARLDDFIDCYNPELSHQAVDVKYHDTNPFAVKVKGARSVTSCILSHQPKSFEWPTRSAKRHPSRQVPESVYALACETLNQIIDGKRLRRARAPELLVPPRIG